ncbi:variable surface protein Vir18 [Plasmodium vivax Mauritania I]|uniref:Variable surface protein Vir18 n=1 Tax=Plasmodium vivax Mauritania I TaxID=1035515 RepID=A0A0J9TFS9_PLAVI|nr:variable surface protein Vir18 [Plasmodium vivax Mauritania I]
MAPWPSISSLYIDNYRKYNEPQCITKYINYQQEIQKQIEALSDPKNFCTKCQKIKQEINEKNNELKNCYAYNLLKTKLINNYEINAFMKKCLEPSKCRYNEAYNVRNPPALKSKSETTCGRSNVCNRVTTPVKESAGKNNISITNDPVVVQPEASDLKGILPSGATGQESIPKSAASASPNSLTSELGSSSNDSSPHVTPGSDSSTTAIAQQKNLETSSHESDQRSLQHVNGNPLSAQDIGGPTSQDQDSYERSPNGEDAAVITLGNGNPGNEVIANLLERITHLSGLPPLHTKFTDDTAGGDNHLNGGSLETPIEAQNNDATTGDNSEIPYKKYTTMALAPTGIIMLMTLLSKVNQIKRRNTRKDIKENIERILLLESPAKTEESSYSFAYSPSQYWEK